ncbi:ATP-dependent DNA helicase IV [Enterococcus hirae]|nr:UvrD-helicase domain-containing protein [Enterococcus sp. 10A9_DIV0425]THE12904.1 ATP-dependent DNA helicase IV [Enterococcus hirae]
MFSTHEEEMKEANHLKFVHEELIHSEIRLTEFLATNNQEGLETIRELSSETRVNLASISEKLDSFANIESLNKQIDQYNYKLESAKRKLDSVKRLIPSPYFGKISVDFIDDASSDVFYFGINGFTNEDNQDLIYDWRSPIAELFYNNELGNSHYKVKDRKIPVKINNRRQLITKGSELLNWFDTDTAIQDDVLLESLESDSSKKMKDITATIQMEQNKIIRDLLSEVVVVNGVAGSGKTSVILQRIAYLMYTNRETYRADNILILSPNEYFGKYISEVLPSLGEENPATYTLLDFVKRVSELELETESEYFERINSSYVSKTSSILQSADFLDAINEYEDFTPVFRDLVFKNKVIISANQIEGFFDQTPDSMSYSKRISATKRRLMQEWEQLLMRQSKTEKIHQQILQLTEQQQIRKFGRLIGDDSSQKLQKHALKLLNERYRSITNGIDHYQWIHLEALFSTIFSAYAHFDLPKEAKKTLDYGISFLYMYHKLIEPLNLPLFKVILIDEVQDYTQAQLVFLKTIFDKSSYTLVGDQNQAIFNTTVSFEKLQAIFSSKSTAYYHLTKSYRSTGNITNFFSQFSMGHETFEIVPVRPLGQEITCLKYHTYTDFKEICLNYLDQNGLTQVMIICENEAILQKLSEHFVQDQRISLIDIAHAKGLEFPHVIVCGFVMEELDDHLKSRLYTAISRATETLAIASIV